MSNSYTPTTNFGAKDSLSASDPNKVVRGSEFSTEFSAIENAFAASAPKASPTFTGTATFETVDVADLTSSGTATLSGVVPSSDVLPVTGSVSVSDHMSIGNTETPDTITATALDDLIVGSLSSDGGVIVLSSPTGTGAYSFIDAATGSVAGRIIYQHSTDEMSFQAGGFGRARFTGNGTFAVCQSVDAPNADDRLYVGTSSGVESFTVSGITATANCYIRLDSLANRRNAIVWETNGVGAFTMERGDSDDADSTALYLHPGAPDGGSSDSMKMAANGAVTFSQPVTAPSFPTSSDRRLKDNIVDAPSASDDIDALQVRSFDWATDGAHQTYGMIAQELQTVVPDAVMVVDKSSGMLGVDYTKLVPMLVKEIQELRTRVANLEP